ncbi:MAG: 3'-5' exonuclease [Pirellulales bacterium]
MADPAVKYLVVDVESVADGELIGGVRYPHEGLSKVEAVRRYRDELMAERQSDFVPYTFQIPIAVVVAKVGADMRLLDLTTLDDPQYRPHIITRNFWLGWEKYDCPTLVTFNGRSFDIPLLELAAFRYGLSIPRWFAWGQKYDQPRNRYNLESHLDLHDLLANFGATRFAGGLNLAAQLLGKPGKLDVQGHMVQDMYDAGQLAQINDYCRCDVLDTYFVFLRSMVMIGRLTLEKEQALIQKAKQWLTERQADIAAYRTYLDAWGDWDNPW